MTVIRECETQGRMALLRARRQQYGFLNEQDVAAVARDESTRLTLLLVRCGAGRFLAPAQDVAHFIEAIEKGGLDYVRDVSIPADTVRSGVTGSEIAEGGQ